VSRSGRRRGVPHLRDDDGSASVEFVFLGILLLVPLVYVIVAIAAVQGAAYGVSGASRAAGRAFVQAPSDADARARAFAAARVALADHGIELHPEDLDISCSAQPCRTPGATVTVEIDLDIALPLVPEVFGTIPASVAVRGRHVEVVDRFVVAGADGTP
jgi:Flp pilus assembly protein TadG